MAVAAKVRLKTTTKWLSLLLLVVVVWSNSVLAGVRRTEIRVGERAICQVAPQWTARAVDTDGNVGPLVNPMQDARGKVVLVALTDASSGHSLNQAQKLQSLESYFQDISMTDLNFILVNSLEARDELPDLVVEKQSLTIVQDDENQTVWSKLAGKKDDLFVYDRCGRLTYAIPFPLSIIHPRQQLVESSVISTYLDDLCSHRSCHDLDNTNFTVEDSADTELINTTHSSLADVTQLVNVTDEFQVTPNGSIELVLPDIFQNNQLTPFLEEDVNDSGLEADHNRNMSRLELRPEEPLTVQPPPGGIKKITARTTAQPPVQSGLWSLYQNVLNYMPWTSKQNKNAERQLNTVQKYIDTPDEKVKESSSILAENATSEEEEYQCNVTAAGTCHSWTKKKLDQARVCCNLQTCNRNAQYLQKHCKHYSEDRCKKVRLVLRCCQANQSKQEENSIASKPKS